MTDDTALQAPSTVYSYSLDPHQVTIGATVRLLLTISNMNAPDPDAPDPAEDDEQTILVGIPSGTVAESLTSNPGSIIPVSRTPKWSAVLRKDPDGYALELYGPPVAPGASVQIEMQQVQINDAVGGAILPVIEAFSGEHGGVLVIKERAQTRIIEFYADPPMVTQGKPTTLHWTVSGGTRVVIWPQNIERPVNGTEFYSDTLTVPVDTPTSTYTLQLWSANMSHTDATAAAYIGKVSATLSSEEASWPVYKGQLVTLDWTSEYAAVPLLLTPTPPNIGPVREKGSVTLDPFDYLQPNQDILTFELFAPGYTGDPKTSGVTSSVSFKCAATRVLWFRYTDASKQEFSFQTRNTPKAIQIDFLSVDTYRLTAQGPAGPIYNYLGPGPYLQVQLLSATPNPASPGASVTVEYTTLNAVSATLNGKSVPLDTRTQSGKTTVTATASMDLILEVTSQDGGTISSLLPLVIKK